MCWQNYTQKAGCGHYGDSLTGPYTLCPDAQKALLDLRGPTSPPLSPPPPPPNMRSPLQRSSGSFARRFFSASLVRSSTSASLPSFSPRRCVSGPPGEACAPRTSTSSPLSVGSTLGVDVMTGAGGNITDHEIKEVLCENPVKRTRVVSGEEMRICKFCSRAVSDMRFMIERLDRTGSIKGTTAFDEYLKLKGDAVGGKDVYG